MSTGRYLSYANVMATLAFFVAIGGTTIAATKLDGRLVKPGTIKGKALKAATIQGSKLRPNTIRGREVLEENLATVPSATVATNARDSATLGGLSAAELTDDCPPGTRPYAGVCIEEALGRGVKLWPAAAKDCDDDGRRLPALDEMEGFRQEPGITLGSGGEYTSSFLDPDAPSSSGFMTVTISDSGTINTGTSYTNGGAFYRCVAPRTNG